MTVTSGFFNSVNHDRLYDAEQISSIFDGIIEDGVYESIGDAFMVTANQGANNSVIVGTGRAWFDHTWTLNDTAVSFTLDPPSTLLGRIDMIVIDVDSRESVRANSIKLITGAYAEQPVEPTLINEDSHKQYPIAKIERAAGSEEVISQADITYLVGTEKCPLVIGVLDALNVSNYLQQYNAEFEEWFQGVKDVFGDENPAFHFQEQLNKMNEKVDSLIPLATQNVFDAFLNNESPFSVTLVSGMDQYQDFVDLAGSVPYCTYNGVHTIILPDGKLATFFFKATENSNASVLNYGIYVLIYSSEGVLIENSYQDLGPLWTRNLENNNDYTFAAPFCYLSSDNAQYPSTILIGLVGNMYNHDIPGCPRIFAKSIVISISETLTVSFSIVDNTDALDSNDMNDDRWKGMGTTRLADLNDGRHVGMVSASESSSAGGAVVRAICINEDGTISLGPKKTVPYGDSGAIWGTYGLVYSYGTGYIHLFLEKKETESSDDLIFSSKISTVYSGPDYSIYNKYHIDPQTLAILKPEGSIPNPNNTFFDNLWDLEYCTIESGSLKELKYNHKSSPDSVSTEKCRIVDLSNMPQLFGLPFGIYRKNATTDIEFIGIDTILNQVKTKNITTYLVGKKEGTGVTFSSETGTFFGTFKYAIYPSKFCIKQINEDSIFVVYSICSPGTRREGMKILDAPIGDVDHQSAFVLVKIERKE